MTLQQYEKLRQVIIEANPEEFETKCVYYNPDCQKCKKSDQFITLADILLAYNKTDTANWHGLCVNFKGVISLDGTPKAEYNLIEDNLDLQSDELKEFLYKVLVENGV